MSTTTVVFCTMIAFIICATVVIVWVVDLRTAEQICAAQSKPTPFCEAQVKWIQKQIQAK
jgi:hypothetical protein